jgi:hypothetical protein
MGTYPSLLEIARGERRMNSRLSYQMWILLVLLCISIVFLVYFILIGPPHEGIWSRFLDALSRLCVSYVAGLTIYALVVALPRKEDRRNIGESVAPRTRRIISYANDALKDLQRHCGPAFDRKLASREDVERLCKGVNPTNPTPGRLATNLSRQATVAEMLGVYKIWSEREIQRMLIFSVYLDTQLIRLLNRLLDSSYFRFCDAYFVGEGLNLFRPKTANLKDVDAQLFEYLQIINELEQYADSHLK